MRAIVSNLSYPTNESAGWIGRLARTGPPGAGLRREQPGRGARPAPGLAGQERRPLLLPGGRHARLHPRSLRLPRGHGRIPRRRGRRPRRQRPRRSLPSGLPREVSTLVRSRRRPGAANRRGLPRRRDSRPGEARHLRDRPGRPNPRGLPEAGPEVPQPRSPSDPLGGAPPMSAAKLPNVVIPRTIRLHYEPFTKHFKGFEDVEAVRGIFGPRTRAVLRSLKVEFFSSKWGYMGVSDEDGHLVVSPHYLRTGNRRDIYLDGVHELVHDVEVDVPSVPRPQVMRRDHEVAILVADAHVAPLRGEELDFQGPKDGAGPRSEDPANGLHVLKAFEVLREGLVVKADIPGDDDVRELGGTHRRRTPERIRPSGPIT